MKTEQQAREALDALDDYARMANITAIGPLKVLSDFITQAAEDKSARNLLDGATFEQYRDQLAIGNLTALDQIGFDNLLHNRLEQAAADKRIADAVREAAERYDAVASGVGGCTDHGCVVQHRKGLGTNGGCRCWSDEIKAQRMMRAGQALRDSIPASVLEGG